MDYEILVQKVYETILESGDNAIDVGAHVGRHTFPITNKIAPIGKVFAFEPLPMCLRQLSKSIAKKYYSLKEIISLYPFALSDYEAEAEFIVAVDALGHSCFKERKYDYETRTDKIRVNVRKLDNILFKIY